MAALFESLTEAQWAAFSFVMLGMALIAGMLVRRAVPWLAAVYIPTSVVAGFLLLAAGPLVPEQTGLGQRARAVDPSAARVTALRRRRGRR